MSQPSVAVVSDARAFAVAPSASAIERASSGGPGALRRFLFWPAEFLRLIAVAYLFPLVVLAIGLPIALTVTGLLIAGQWVWQSLS